MKISADIAVVGAGAAGIAAAVSAARAGAATVLLDARPAAGGTGGFSGLTTLCGLYDDAGNFLNAGLPREFALAVAAPASSPAAPVSAVQMGRVWVLPYRPERFREVAAQWIATTPKLKALWHTPVTQVRLANGRITQLNQITVGAVIDCSGTAEVAQALGLSTLATDETTQATAVIFPLRQVQRPLRTAAEMAQVLLPLARAGFPSLSLQAGFAPGEFTAKFAGPPAQVPDLLAFLRENVAGFAQCETPQREIVAARRAGRMIPGRYLLTGAEVLAGRKFPDGAARNAWPIEQWDRRGSVRFQYLSAGTSYDIPARSLQAAAVANLFMAGKTISADVTAIASARVMGCCLATGAAAGVLAAQHVAS